MVVPRKVDVQVDVKLGNGGQGMTHVTSLV